MSRLWARTRLAVLVAIALGVTQVGCTRSLLTPSTDAAILAGTEPSKDELPPSEALKVCLVAARNLDKAGNEIPAIAQYERVLNLAPDNVEVLHRLAVLYDRQSEFAKADAAYLKLTQARPRDANLFNDWGYSHYLRNKWDDAERHLRRALELDPTHVRARANLGMVFGHQGRHDDALQTFRDARLSEPEARCNLAFVYWSQGRLDDARRECQIARQIDPSGTMASNMLAQLDRPPAPPRNAERGARPDRQAFADARRPQKLTLESLPAGPSGASGSTANGSPAGVAPSPVYVSPGGTAWYPVPGQ
jgi:Flp pilus assembly protein TadD